MSRVTKLVVGKGKTLRPTEQEEWIKEYYELEIVVDDDHQIDVARANALGLIDGWLTKTVLEHQKIPNIDLADLEDHPWTTFKTKESAKEGEAGWIFSNTKGAEELVDALKTAKGKLELGLYEFKFSGAEDKFIQRRPLKR